MASTDICPSKEYLQQWAKVGPVIFILGK